MPLFIIGAKIQLNACKSARSTLMRMQATRWQTNWPQITTNWCLSCLSFLFLLVISLFSLYFFLFLFLFFFPPISFRPLVRFKQVECAPLVVKAVACLCVDMILIVLLHYHHEHHDSSRPLRSSIVSAHRLHVEEKPLTRLRDGWNGHEVSRRTSENGRFWLFFGGANKEAEEKKGAAFN